MQALFVDVACAGPGSYKSTFFSELTVSTVPSGGASARRPRAGV